MKDADDQPLRRISLDQVEGPAIWHERCVARCVAFASRSEHVIPHHLDNGREVIGSSISELHHVSIGKAHESADLAGQRGNEGRAIPRDRLAIAEENGGPA